MDIQSITAGLEPASATPSEFMIPYTSVIGPKFNHRQIFRDIEELAESLTEHGQLEAIKVRPVHERPGMFEIVYGERRWRAFGLIANRANNDPARIKIRCKVEVLNDRGVVVAQAVENLDRSDPHPLEEALIYERLLLPVQDGGEGMTMFNVMQRLRKPVERITDRMELLKLCPDARAAYLGGKFTDAHALLVARIPDASMQVKFVRDILSLDDPANEGRLMAVEQARKHVRKYFMLPLATAPFAGSDTTLVPEAGSCSTCPHNTRTQQVLFRDIEPEQAFCVNVPCFERKADAQWTRRSEHARANGQDVLSEQDARLVWPFPNSDYVATSGPYIPLSEPCREFEPSKDYAELVQICESTGHHVARALARRPGTTEIHELLTLADARAVVVQARQTLHAVENAGTPSDTDMTTAASLDGTPATEAPDGGREERWKQIQEDAVRNKREQTQQYRAAMGVLIKQIPTASEFAFDQLLRIVAKRFAQNCLVDTIRDVAARRGLKPTGPVSKDRGMRAESEAAVLAFIDRTSNQTDVLALIAELVLTKDATNADPFAGLREALSAIGVREEDARQGRTGPEKPVTKTRKAPAKRTPKQQKNQPRA
jgi:ParB/RepB/Spo0J family partition protein